MIDQDESVLMRLSTDSVDPRGGLRFRESAAEAFSFLVERYGFQLICRDSTLVRWESGSIFLNVYHGRSSYELHIEVGQRDRDGESDRPFTLEELMRLNSPSDAKKFRYFASRTPQGVRRGLAQLADLLVQHGDAVLRGDLGVFSRLRAQRRTWRHDFVREGHLERVRTVAELARQRGDWPELARLYAEIAQDLTPAEAKRLEYALKRIRKGPT